VAATYFHRWPAGEDPAELLRGENQYSTPWGTPNQGPCDKCRGEGTTRYACRSCLERGGDADCPVCAGRVEFDDVCPACEGDGRIDRTTREGVSVFPSLEGLCRYIAEREAETAGYVAIELEGELTGDLDLDADAGALLIRPTRLVAGHPFEYALLEGRLP
jgi:hypothetical protein